MRDLRLRRREGFGRDGKNFCIIFTTDSVLVLSKRSAKEVRRHLVTIFANCLPARERRSDGIKVEVFEVKKTFEELVRSGYQRIGRFLQASGIVIVLRRKARYTSGIVTKVSGQRLGKKPFSGEYNWSQGIDVYQEPEFDDFDPFADDPRYHCQPAKNSGKCRSKDMEVSYRKPGELSIQENLLECESECENRINFGKLRLGQRISNEEFLSPVVIKKELKLGQRLSKDMYRSLETYRTMEYTEEEGNNEDYHRENDRLKVFDSITPEPITDEEAYTDEQFPQNRSHVVTVAEEVLYRDVTDEANIPSEVSGYSFLSDSSGIVSPIIDTESQAAIFGNISVDENNMVEENEEELFEEDDDPDGVLLSPPVSKESASILAKIASSSQFTTPNCESPTIPIVTRALNPTSKSNQNIFLNANQDLEESNRHKKTESKLKNTFSKNSVNTSMDLKQHSSRNLNCNICNHNVIASMEEPTLSRSNKISSSHLNSDATLNSPLNTIDAKDSGYMNTCTKVFHKLFQMHVSEVTLNETPETEDETPFVIPSSRNSNSLISKQPKKIHSIQNLPTQDSSSPLPIQFHTLVDDELLEYLDHGKPVAPETDFIDRVFVDVVVKSNEVDAKGSFRTRTITLEFPVHKDDAQAAMIVINNPHLHNPEIQYVNSPSEIVYNLPTDIASNAQHCIGTFKIRCALRIPVSFKLSCVQQLEIVPQMGVILPNQILNIQVYSSTSPESWIDRLKFEGILLLAAPFIFNKGRCIANVNTEDVQEFWGKFCGSRFRFAQTRFISIQVYHPMVLRRRQSLALEAHEQAERLNDSRFSLLAGFLLLIIAYAWYFFKVYLPEARRVEFVPATGYRGWRDNMANVGRFWKFPGNTNLRVIPIRDSPLLAG
ncbi:unnamed protein product [Allacma fusca]|uniref:Uncharacterized protein n=1 Tax=Allacma fusca TaxID=39272 RepID=A0A8J2JPK4_9HEXA|nr:unnamed protein product [Allacma fusca]